MTYLAAILSIWVTNCKSTILNSFKKKGPGVTDSWLMVMMIGGGVSREICTDTQSRGHLSGRTYLLIDNIQCFFELCSSRRLSKAGSEDEIAPITK